jgi:hypothetical protein
MEEQVPIQDAFERSSGACQVESALAIRGSSRNRTRAGQGARFVLSPRESSEESAKRPLNC